MKRMKEVIEGNQMQTNEELTNFHSNALKSCRHLCRCRRRRRYVAIDEEEICWILN